MTTDMKSLEARLAELDDDALSKALLTLRPLVWKDIESQVLTGEIPAAQLPIKVEMWSAQFRPYFRNAIKAYLEAAMPDAMRLIAHKNKQIKRAEEVLQEISVEGQAETGQYAELAVDLAEKALAELRGGEEEK